MSFSVHLIGFVNCIETSEKPILAHSLNSSNRAFSCGKGCSSVWYYVELPAEAFFTWLLAGHIGCELLRQL